MIHSIRRVNKLRDVVRATRYLEIGVLYGDTFKGVDISEKVGVDPEFRFDAKAVESPATKLFQTTSDDYFFGHAGSEQFDIIFIDGLHQFEQVLRDFQNALVCSHPRSVLVLDDTVPNDIYSANPDQGEALRHRRASGSNDIAWHGDVFKLVFFIHDFCMCLDYRTIMEGGNPQTLVWRSNTFRRKPIFNDVERISRLSYYELHRNIDVLRRSGEDDAIKACDEALNNK